MTWSKRCYIMVKKLKSLGIKLKLRRMKMVTNEKEENGKFYSQHVPSGEWLEVSADVFASRYLRAKKEKAILLEGLRRVRNAAHTLTIEQIEKECNKWIRKVDFNG